MFRHNNLDHSMMTGLPASRNSLSEQHDLSQVNTDPEYYETMAPACPPAAQHLHPRLRWPPCTLPNLIVIGAMKSGTTSLHHYLNLHPQIFMTWNKELNFFVAERNWPRGRAWYERHFKTTAGIRGESSPNYTNYPYFPGVAERMHSLLPDARIIYILRNPIDRTISHYQHQYARNLENRSLTEALANLDYNEYVDRSRYAWQLDQFLSHYPLEHILVLSQEDLLQKRRPTLQRVFRWLGVAANFDDPRFDRLYHESSSIRRKSARGLRLAGLPGFRLIRKLPEHLASAADRWLFYPLSLPVPRPVLPDDLRSQLADYLQSDVQRLRALTGQSFPDWSI
jgi:hypothetical protein